MSVPVGAAPRPLGGALALVRHLPTALGGAIALTGFVAALISSRIVTQPSGLTAIWLAAGVNTALLAVFGPRWWPAVAVGAFGEAVVAGHGLLGVLGVGLANTLAPLVAAAVLRRDPIGAPWVDRPAGLLRLTLAALVTSVLGGLFGVSLLRPDLEFVARAPLVLHWALVDTVGTLLIAPAVLAWLTPLPPRPLGERRSAVEGLALALGMLATSAFVFHGPEFTGGLQPKVFLLFPFLSWAAFRFGLRGATVVTVLASLGALSAVLGEVSTADELAFSRAVLTAQLLAAVLSLSACLLGGAVAARDAAESRAAGRDEEMRRLSSALPSTLFRFAVSRDGQVDVRFLTDGIERILGVASRELERDFQQTMQFIVEEDRARVIAGIGTTVAQRVVWTDQFRVRRIDGTVRWIRGQSSPDPSPSADGSLVWNGVLSDITAEQSARLADIAQQQVLEHLATGDTQSSALARLAELVERQVPGAYVGIWLRDEATNSIRVGAAPRLPADLVAAADGMPADGGSSIIGAVLQTGERCVVPDLERYANQTDLLRRARSRGLRALWIVPFVGEGGRAIGAVGAYFAAPREPDRAEFMAFETVTTLAGLVVQRFRSEAARQAMEDRLEQAQRMEALGRLAGGIAHDFNNLLTVISNAAALLEDELAADAGREELELIRDSSRRAAGLVRQLLAFGRRQPWREERVDLGGLVRRLEPMVRGVIGEQHLVAFDLDGAAPAVQADIGQLEQVVLNLVMNARDAMDGVRGALTMRVRRTPMGGARLEVEDTGHGMSPEVLRRIFEPFFTTKAVGQGTGLGLAMAFAIVERSGGRFEVQSAPGAGATFAMEWPKPAA